MFTIVPALFLLLLAVLLSLWSFGALVALLVVLQRPRAVRRSLGAQIAHLRHRWYERKLPSPKTPHDCPLCATLHADPSTARPTPPPYETLKSRRGRKKRSATEGFACFNPECVYFGCTEATVHALVADGWEGKQHDIRRLRCQACQHVFSVRRNTPCFRLHKPLLVIQSAFVLLACGMSRADIARFLGVDDDTVARWLDRFGAHADHLHDALLHNLTPEILQLDEIRA